jgi:multimeric flavodoxin WrbA
MQIVVLTGSSRKNGNSSYLADRFIAGAEEAGHSIFRFDAAFKKVNGCIA